MSSLGKEFAYGKDWYEVAIHTFHRAVIMDRKGSSGVYNESHNEQLLSDLNGTKPLRTVSSHAQKPGKNIE
jgi:hypothetical protein